jgi:hypothetical protein
VTTATTQLDGKNVNLGRIVWSTVIALSVLLFLTTFPLYVQSINDFMSSSDAAQVGLYLAVHLIYMVPVFLIALWIGIRLSNNWLGLLTSAVLAMYAVGLNIPILSSPTPMLVKVLGIVSLVGTIGRFAIYFMLPDGRLSPRWPSILLIAIYAISVAVGAQLLPEFYMWIDRGAWILVLLRLVYQYRQSQDAGQKRQIKWIAIGVVGILAAVVVALIATPFIETFSTGGIQSLELYQRAFNIIENLLNLFGTICLAFALLSTNRSGSSDLPQLEIIR